ncbi:MAG TPA: hypothetical protein VIJ60_03250 [Acidimicrobiales bacterium]
MTCNKTGITGPTGKVTVVVYAFKGKHPAGSAPDPADWQGGTLSGRRSAPVAIPVPRRGRRDD